MKTFYEYLENGNRVLLRESYDEMHDRFMEMIWKQLREGSIDGFLILADWLESIGKGMDASFIRFVMSNNEAGDRGIDLSPRAFFGFVKDLKSNFDYNHIIDYVKSGSYSVDFRECWWGFFADLLDFMGRELDARFVRFATANITYFSGSMPMLRSFKDFFEFGSSVGFHFNNCHVRDLMQAMRPWRTGHDPTETAKFIAKNKTNFSNNEVIYLVQSVDSEADQQLIAQELLKKNLNLDNDTKNFLRS
jgi:hypothetical protein